MHYTALKEVTRPWGRPGKSTDHACGDCGMRHRHPLLEAPRPLCQYSLYLLCLDTFSIFTLLESRAANYTSKWDQIRVWISLQFVTFFAPLTSFYLGIVPRVPRW